MVLQNVIFSISGEPALRSCPVKHHEGSCYCFICPYLPVDLLYFLLLHPTRPRSSYSTHMVEPFRSFQIHVQRGRHTRNFSPSSHSRPFPGKYILCQEAKEGLTTAAVRIILISVSCFAVPFLTGNPDMSPSGDTLPVNCEQLSRLDPTIVSLVPNGSMF